MVRPGANARFAFCAETMANPEVPCAPSQPHSVAPAMRLVPHQKTLLNACMSLMFEEGCRQVMSRIDSRQLGRDHELRLLPHQPYTFCLPPIKGFPLLRPASSPAQRIHHLSLGSPITALRCGVTAFIGVRSSAFDHDASLTGSSGLGICRSLNDDVNADGRDLGIPARRDWRSPLNRLDDLRGN